MAEKSAVGFFTFRSRRLLCEDNMTPTINPIRPGRFKLKPDPVKLTALLYLKEALLEERYEECAEMIAIAKEFGAQPFEIGYLLEDPRRLPGGSSNDIRLR